MPAKKKQGQKKQIFNPRRSIFFFSFLLLLTFGFLSTFFLFKSSGLFSPETCANSLSCISDLRGEYVTDAPLAEFNDKNYAVPPQRLSTNPVRVLGVEDAANKRIEVDLTSQRLYAYENNNQVFSFPISSGKWGKTPTGEFTIWIKLRYTRMKGGSKELHTYYDLPNVPYTMFFYNDKIPKYRGFGIHGAYWHNNFGHPMSHGCINMAIPDAEQLYNWATPTSTAGTTLATAENPGTKIIIYGTAPNY